MNRDLLVQYLESLSELDDRYANIKCINYNPGTGEKKGVFSLVFSANDSIQNSAVALKFFDPEQMGDAYRILAFDREPEILKTLIGKRRCLQLVQPMQQHTWKYDAKISIPIKYFALKWIDGEVEDVFQQQELYDPIYKLRLFVDVTSAVEAIHRFGLFHRDIKPDNLRYFVKMGRRIVVLIDMGTAARCDTPPIMRDYTDPVGHLWYSAPEAHCGLAGHREMAKFTDFYALGSLLYELFNKDYFGAVMLRNPTYGMVLAACSIDLQATPPSDRIQAWKTIAKRFRHAVPPPSIDSPGTSVPPAVATLLTELLHSLVKFDYSERAQDFEWIRGRALHAIYILASDRLQRLRLEQRRVARENRLAKLRHRQQLAERNP
jgi:serine/threonine protein kinase